MQNRHVPAPGAERRRPACRRFCVTLLAVACWATWSAGTRAGTLVYQELLPYPDGWVSQQSGGKWVPWKGPQNADDARVTNNLLRLTQADSGTVGWQEIMSFTDQDLFSATNHARIDFRFLCSNGNNQEYYLWFCAGDPAVTNAAFTESGFGAVLLNYQQKTNANMLTVHVWNHDGIHDVATIPNRIGGTSVWHQLSVRLTKESAAGGTGDVYVDGAFARNVPFTLSGSGIGGAQINCMDFYGYSGVTPGSDETLHLDDIRLYAGRAETHYVANGASNLWPFASWEHAAADVQDAVDAGLDGDTVWVADGVHASGGRTITGESSPTRVVVERALTVRSANGPATTTIDGTGNHRCLTLAHSNAVVRGFTLRNGYAADSGGGAHVVSGTLRQCVLVDNHAGDGAGTCLGPGGELWNCLLSGNHATNHGGGLLFDGGGTVRNCTLAGNSADGLGGGALCPAGSVLENSILYHNEGDNWSGFGGGPAPVFRNSCTTPDPGGTNNVTGDPRFADEASDDFHLTYGSPCIEGGTTQGVAFTEDLDGNARLADGDLNGDPRFDIGCFEYDMETADSDGDGLADADEVGLYRSCPTNVNTDGDGLDDGEEMIADTDLTNPASCFWLLGVSNIPPVKVYFVSSTNRLYTLQACTNMPGGPWRAVEGQSNVTGRGGPDDLSDNGQPTPRFYRIKVALP